MVVGRWLMVRVCCLLLVACCLLYVVRCSLLVVRCLLFVVCCLLFVACWLVRLCVCLCFVCVCVLDGLFLVSCSAFHDSRFWCIASLGCVFLFIVYCLVFIVAC